MIESKEIRIGNWVLENGNPVEVDAFDYYGSLMTEDRNYDDNYRTIKDPEGVALTIELLKKLGATQPYNDQPDYYEFCLFSFNWHDEYGFCLWDTTDGHILNGTIHYKYLHQLQNLIFALTGKELIISL